MFLTINCAHRKRGSKTLINKRKKKIVKVNKYSLTDISGKFDVIRISGLDKNNFKNAVVKREIISRTSGKVIEREIMFSTVGFLNNKIKIMRPLKSEYAVYFDGKKYLTEMKLNIKNRSLDINLVSPEMKWNGSKQVKFPKGSGVYCFFGQLVECINETGFIKKAARLKAGVMKLHIIWNGYPYIQQQYVKIPIEVFTKATFSYDDTDESGEVKFILKFAEQIIFYVVDKHGQFLKTFWISQGLSLVPK